MNRIVPAILVFIFSMPGCASNSYEEKEDWFFQLATPLHYDVWVEHVELELSGVRHWYHPAGTMSCCWRGPNGPKGITGRLEPFPNFIALQWFSLSERKYYQRLISVKPEWKNRMRELAPVQTANGVRHEPRRFLVFGLAPGGEIVVWIKGQIGNEVELTRLQANQIEGDPQDYAALLKTYRDKHGEYLKENGIPLSGW